MFGNDLYGDCVPCDSAHSLMLRTAAAGKIIIPTVTDVLSLYTAMTGFNPDDPSTDRGTSETAACEYMVSTGLLGHKADAYANISPANQDHLRWAVEIFGHCRLGLNMPASAANQFNAGEPWDVVSDDGGIEGGHDVCLTWYDDNHFGVITWGKFQPVTAAFLARYCEEAHIELFNDWIMSNGVSVSGFSLPKLISDLNSL
jgi:hypothetical protein